jgi:AcrR family transcriptional regulator
MTDAKVDRRVRRTKELLRGALYALVIERGYDRLTVQDIIDRADVGRSTFYAHFRDKEDLLLSGFEELRAAFEHRDGDGNAGAHGSWTAAVFEHAWRSRDLYRALVGKQGAEIAKRHLHDLLAELLRSHLEQREPAAEPGVPVDLVVEFAVSALVGLAAWWLETDQPYSPAKIDEIYRRLTEPGIRAALRPRA